MADKDWNARALGSTPADLVAARAAVETISATGVLPASVLGTSTFTWTKTLDEIEKLYKQTNGGAQGQSYYNDLTAFYTKLAANLAT